MANAEGVAVIHTKYNLPEVLPGLMRLETATRHKIVEQLASCDVFHNKKKLFARFIHVPQTQQIRVHNELHNHNFTFDAKREFVLFRTQIPETHAAIDEHLLWNDLDGC